ncbi:MAG: tRNA nucleotidyltransferase [Clostridia bacterium]|nr:tRNA nucleotidyltransferase [Clostridia bacterium]
MTIIPRTTNADASLQSAFALPDYIHAILSRFDAAGYEVFCIGGCVRDAMRGTAPHDWDLCTAALPAQTMALFADKRCLDVGIKHGTVTVLWDDIPVEITTYRTEEAYIGHRAPSSVSFTPSLREDCLRRDFTINAMAYHPTAGLRDYFGGIDDLKSRILRCVGEPSERFDEDALRILRALRFASVLDFEIEAETAKALHACAPLLSAISGERIFAEFRRMLTGVRAHRLLAEYADVIGVFYPPLAACKDHARALSDAFALCTTAETRLAAAFCLCGCTDEEDVRRTVSRLPTERIFVDRVTSLVTKAACPPPLTRPEMRRALSSQSPDSICSQLTLHAALFPDHKDACQTADALCREITASGEATRIAHLAVNGRDLTAVGFQGRAIGDALQTLLDAVIDGQCENTREALLFYAASLLP